MVLRDELASAGQACEQGIERIELIEDSRLFDSFTEAGAELGAAEKFPCASTRHLPGERGARSAGKSEETVVFDPAA